MANIEVRYREKGPEHKPVNITITVPYEQYLAFFLYAREQGTSYTKLLTTMIAEVLSGNAKKL